MKRLIEVIYLRSDQLDEGYRTELELDYNQLIAFEIYDNGDTRIIKIKDGITDYILNGKRNLGEKSK